MNFKLMVMVGLLATVSLVTTFTFDESLAQLNKKSEITGVGETNQQQTFRSAFDTCDIRT